MRSSSLVLLLLGTTLSTLACDVCTRRPDGILSWFGHGTGPQSQWDILIVAASMAIVFMTLWGMLKAMIQPADQAPDHIKQLVIKDNTHE
ncbi:hypothetical protein [Paraflavitalea pollutisoli]|uniref:hypothetical protein n=1 Tax=Paraflavitalea pollutisoli TaxID=3034143 RepID=UPI0023EAB3D8|nr:hypothetical protein [Paraflavitalea sp. H1-2-19X]